MSFASILLKLAPVVSCLLFIVAASKNVTCYYPDGSKAADKGVDYVPCKKLSDGGVTYCCHPDDICTTTGICVGSAGLFYRGGCTDQTWTSSLCPVLCAKVSMSNFANFFPCTPGRFSYDNWTCDGPGNTNNTCNIRGFPFDAGHLFAPYVESATTIRTTTVTGSSATGTATTASNEGPCPTYGGTIIGVGVGVGVTLGLSTIAALFGFIAERRKRRAAERIAAVAQIQSDQRNPKGYSSGVVQEAGSQVIHEIGDSVR